MNKLIPGLIGLMLGAAATWLVMKHPAEAAEEAAAPKIEITTGSAAIAKQIAIAGITTASPTASTSRPSVEGFGRVLDPAPLITQLAEVEMARMAAAASEREFNRARALYAQENISAQALESAQTALERDRAQFAVARARLISTWGSGLTGRTDLPALAESVALGTAALVRLELPPGTSTAMPIQSVQVGALAGESRLHPVEVVGPAPNADPQSQGAGYLALWKESPLPPGAALRAIFPGAGGEGKVVIVPRSTLVRHEGAVFVYVPIEKGGFERRLVEVGEPVADGVTVTEGITENDKVVVIGAQQLLATELLSTSEPEE